MTPEMTARLERLKPLRVILRIADGGEIEGKIENSFSMDWSKKRVQVLWSGTAYSILGEHYLNAIESAEHTAGDDPGIVVDPLSPECPIEVDLVAWLSATSKFDSRNAPFKVRVM